ncbi:MAG TPA: HD domain-containing phosphohydrolase [Candidatus Acidoferrum sp.]|nr:HD domain-containing phosphohydrolase [Candidatus Acidoferrum sp.]
MSNAEVSVTPQIEAISGAIAQVRPSVVRVLVVDDELAAAKLIALMLSSPAIGCTTASSGEDALVALQRERFDAVISDLQMPGISGMELLTQVRRSYPHMAFLVTTGVDDLEVGVQAMRCGADDYLVKPLRESAVRISLESALHKRQLEQQIENYRQHLEQMVAERTGQLREALHQLENNYESTLQALGAAIDLRDSETAGHSRRVCRYSLEIARALGWSVNQLENLARGAYLHDIGKLGIPDGILLKPGPLTVEERKVMQRHVQIGFDLIKDIDFLSDASEIVLMHHERYAGGGYPRGLSGSEILLSARIFAIADTLDAITSDRPYRRASTFEEAREIIRKCSGSQFDPHVAQVFLSIPEETWPAIAKDHGQIPLLSSEMRRNDATVRLSPDTIPSVTTTS